MDAAIFLAEIRQVADPLGRGAEDSRLDAQMKEKSTTLENVIYIAY
jgi:hypothetical protein